MYVLDEPRVSGLHPKDTQQLLKVLNRSGALGNSLLLVEHDPEVIEWGEHIVDMGPGIRGRRGGNVYFTGSPRAISALPTRCTARAVRDWKKECVTEQFAAAAPGGTPSGSRSKGRRETT